MAFGGAASLPAVGGQRGPSGRKVAGSTADIPLDLGSVELRQWEPPIGHEGFVQGEEELRLLSQLLLQSAFAWRLCFGLYEQTGYGEPLQADSTDAGGNA